MTKRKIFLHIGFGKTGTTSIQTYFSKKRADLLHQGFLYPETGISVGGHHLLAPLGEENITGNTRNLYDKLKQEISNNNAQKIIISSENYVFARHSFIKDLMHEFSEFDVTIIFYARRQESLIESTFLQWQKIGDDYQGSLENFFQKHKRSFDFTELIAPWENCFGEDAIIARIYDKKVIGDNVCRDIASILGIQELAFESEKKENISLRPEFSSLVGLIDAAGIDKANRTKIITELIRLSEHFDSVKKTPMISAELRKEIFNYYQKSNQVFSDKYLDPEHAAILCNIC